MNGKQILAVRMDKNQIEAETIGEYLHAIMTKLWDNPDAFGGKRPFGNSGWADELYQPLVRDGLIGGMLDEDGHLYTVDYKAGEAAITLAINAAFGIGETGE